MCIARNSLIFRQSEGNNFPTPNDILINLHMHHHKIAISYINFMKILLLLANQWLRTGKNIDIQKVKGQ